MLRISCNLSFTYAALADVDCQCFLQKKFFFRFSCKAQMCVDFVRKIFPLEKKGFYFRTVSDELSKKKNFFEVIKEAVST